MKSKFAFVEVESGLLKWEGQRLGLRGLQMKDAVRSARVLNSRIFLYLLSKGKRS